MDADGPDRVTTPTWWRIVRGLGITACVIVGAVLVLGSVALGDCSAFGGTCPSEPEPILDDDTFGGAFLGTTLAVAGTLFLLKPTVKGMGRAFSVALPAALIMGLMARSAAG